MGTFYLPRQAKEQLVEAHRKKEAALLADALVLMLSQS